MNAPCCHFNRWSYDDATTLIRLWSAGTSANEIAARLARTLQAVRQRVHTLDLTSRRRNQGLWPERYQSRPKAKTETQPRKCLKCLCMFESAHIGNRICDPCKHTVAWESGAGLTVFAPL